MVKTVLSQLIPLVVGSILISVLLSYWGVHYIAGGLFGIAIQFLGYYAFKNILTAIVALKNNQLENERITALTYQGLEVVCHCFK